MAATPEESEQKRVKLVDDIMKRVEHLAAGGLVIPEGYLVQNEVRQAYYILTQPRSGSGDNAKPIIEVCSEESVANALFKMVAAGLSAIRDQCYFIPYGDRCVMQRSYFGAETIARRVAYVTDVAPYVIRQGDKFAHTVDKGKIVHIQHEQDFSNLDNPIVGAYCYVTFQDKSVDIELMTMKEIQRSWNMSRNTGSGNKLQTQFDQEAAKRTVINRALKPIINTSQDANIWQKDFSTDEYGEVVETEHEVVGDRPALQAQTIQLPPATEKQTVPVEAPKAEKQPEPVPAEAPKVAKPAAAKQAPVTDFP